MLQQVVFAIGIFGTLTDFRNHRLLIHFIMIGINQSVLRILIQNPIGRFQRLAVLRLRLLLGHPRLFAWLTNIGIVQTGVCGGAKNVRPPCAAACDKNPALGVRTMRPSSINALRFLISALSARALLAFSVRWINSFVNQQHSPPENRISFNR